MGLMIAIRDFRDLHFKELTDKPGMGSRQKDLRPFRILLNIEDVGPKPFSLSVDLSGNLFFRQEDSLRPSDIDIEVSPLHPLDRSAHQVSLAILEFIVDIVPLRLADFLKDDLLGGLSSDPAEIGVRVSLRGCPRVQPHCPGLLPPPARSRWTGS